MSVRRLSLVININFHTKLTWWVFPISPNSLLALGGESINSSTIIVDKSIGSSIACHEILKLQIKWVKNFLNNMLIIYCLTIHLHLASKSQRPREIIRYSLWVLHLIKHKLSLKNLKGNLMNSLDTFVCLYKIFSCLFHGICGRHFLKYDRV